MTNYEHLKYMIDNRKAVEQFLCYMIESRTEDYCDHVCPMAEKCSRGHNGFGEWLSQEYSQKRLDWGLK